MSQEIMNDFAEEFRKSSGVMRFTSVGIKTFADSINWQVSAENPDPRVMLARTTPTAPGARPDATWRKSDVEAAADPNGWLAEWMTQAWVALIFSRWEDHYRPLFAASAGVPPKEVTSEVMGDIRHLRNDILHNNGVAGKNTRKTMLLKRFSDGQRIVLGPEDIWLLSDKLSVTTPSC